MPKFELYPAIQFRYFWLYFRFPDGRISYYRGDRRRSLYIRKPTSPGSNGWTPEPSYARLFEEKINLDDSKIYQKDIRYDVEFRGHLHWAGFSDIVLRTHLIIPKRIKRNPPG